MRDIAKETPDLNDELNAPVADRQVIQSTLISAMNPRARILAHGTNPANRHRPNRDDHDIAIVFRFVDAKPSRDNLR